MDERIIPASDAEAGMPMSLDHPGADSQPVTESGAGTIDGERQWSLDSEDRDFRRESPGDLPDDWDAETTAEVDDAESSGDSGDVDRSVDLASAEMDSGDLAPEDEVPVDPALLDEIDGQPAERR